MTAQNAPDLSQLFANAQADGNLSRQAAEAVQIQDVGAQIQAALGTPVDQVQAAEVVLVGLLIDDSASMQPNIHAVIEGHNRVLEALRGAGRAANNVLVHTVYLNGRVLYPFVPLEQAVAMDRTNYEANGGTPLYDQFHTFLLTLVAKAQSFMDSGVMARTVSMVITDGEDVHSTRQSPAGVARLVADMVRTENHIIMAAGLPNGRTDFDLIFADMGIPDRWVWSPRADGRSGREQEKFLRDLFRLFSQVSSQASQSAGQYSQAGGFGC